jgi:hypothetical protein
MTCFVRIVTVHWQIILVRLARISLNLRLEGFLWLARDKVL